tara:strand:+ start:37 stop:264 length:228 start_codon:yes stop_codon:yes gene_type:complete
MSNPINLDSIALQGCALNRFHALVNEVEKLEKEINQNIQINSFILDSGELLIEAEYKGFSKKITIPKDFWYNCSS